MSSQRLRLPVGGPSGGSAPGARSPWLPLVPALALVLAASSSPVAGTDVPPGEIRSITRDVSGSVHLTIHDPFQGEALVERSIDLLGWVPLVTVPIASGEITFTDPAPPPGASFYRLAPPVLDYSGETRVTFVEPCHTIPEDSPLVDLAVLRSGPLEAPLELPWSLVPEGATPGQDYVASTGVAHFASGSARATITIALLDDAAPESDEALRVILSPMGGVAAPHSESRVTLADDDSPVRTVVTGAGQRSDYLVTNAGPVSLQILGDRLYWNGLSDRRLLSWGPGELAARTEAAAFGIPVAFDTVGPYLVRLDAQSGINASCTGPGVIGVLIRSSRDGRDPLELARLSICAGSLPVLAASHEAVYYVESEVSPDRFMLRRVPLNGGAPQTLLTLAHPIRSLLVAGPSIWCTEDDFPNPESEYSSVLWRVAIDGSGAERWVTGLRAPRARLVRDAHFLYLADNSYGGQQRLLRISPVDRSMRVLWETNDFANRSDFRDLVYTAGHLFWLNEDSLRALPVTGGVPRTLVADIDYPGFLAAGAGRVSWSEGWHQGRLRSYELSSGAVSVLADPVRRPGSMAYASGILLYSAGTRDYSEEGDSEIRSLVPGTGTSTGVAGGLTMQRPYFASGEGVLHAIDLWAVKRMDANEAAPAVVHWDSGFVHNLAADEQSLYWTTEPLGEIRAINLDGTATRTLLLAGGRPSGLRVQGDRLYWVSSFTSLQSAPVAGGPPTELIAGAGAIATFVTDATHVFAILQDAGQLIRLPLAGGPPMVLTVTPPFSAPFLAQTETHLIWSTFDAIFATPKSGGPTSVLVRNLPESPAALATDGTDVFWLETGADRIRSIPLPP